MSASSLESVFPSGAIISLRSVRFPLQSDTSPLGWACTQGSEEIIQMLGTHIPYSVTLTF